jgi:CelD/BcsL family acetyltransferase involved in cellulose biosynthesis
MSCPAAGQSGNPDGNNVLDERAVTTPFQSKGWLNALASTYGFRPLTFSIWSGGELSNIGAIFCAVHSWATGSRLVSLPFADHCEPFVEGPDEVAALVEWIQAETKRGGWKYIELRPMDSERFAGTVLVPSRSYWLHTLSLEPRTEILFVNLNKDNLQRRIRRAERENLVYERGASHELLDRFYRLMLKTRRRHGLLPQPRAWFQNLLRYMSPEAEIRLVSNGTIPVGAIFTLRHKGTVVYKYGCSDDHYHNLGAMPFLFWKMIEESKVEGAEQIDFGRTDLDHSGLIAFKDHFGATRKQITYLRYPQGSNKPGVAARCLPLMRPLFSVLPGALSSLAGRMLYRHIG